MADDPLHPDDPSPADDPARADGDDERRLLRFVADRGGPAATTNVTGRGGEIGVDGDHIPRLLEALEGRGLVQTDDALLEIEDFGGREWVPERAGHITCED